MKPGIWKYVTAAALFAALAIPVRLAAQEHRDHNKHLQYQLIDLGTFGGLHSYGSVNGDGFSLINNSGVVASFADTALPDPNAPNLCFVPDCLLAHAFRWKHGVKTDLGALPGTNSSAAGSINQRGWMTGQSQNGVIDPVLGFPELRAVLWKRGQIVDLGTLGGHTFVIGVYVNDSGQVVGISDNGIPDPFSVFGIGVQLRTFLWDNGVIQDIGTLGGPDALPGASCSGQPHNLVVGASYTSNVPNPSSGIPTFDPFLWKSGVMTDLGNLGGTMGAAQCANGSSQIIGMATLAGDSVNHAFFWENGSITDLGTLGGDNSEAIWINDAGDVVGSADLPGSQIHDAVIWKDGKIHDLGTVPGDPCSRGRGLNARGQVVGGSSDCANFLHAFVWEDGGPMFDLNTLIAPGSGWQLTNAININDRGEIIAKADPIGVPPIDDEDLGHLMLLIPCDGNHPGIEGCDYSLVDAPATTRVSPAPAGQHLAAVTLSSRMPVGMLNRFRFPRGHWNPGSGTSPAPEQKQEPSACNVTGGWTADDVLAPQFLTGRCTLDNRGKLTGYCTAQIDGHFGCVTRKENACPPGTKAKKPGQARCCYPAGCGQPFPVDLGRSCTIF